MVCRKCGCELRQSNTDALASLKLGGDIDIYSCPECEESYDITNVDYEGIVKLIRNKIRTGKYKEKDKNAKEKVIEEFESLIKKTRKLEFKDNDELDKIRKMTEMLIRKTFGDESHYLVDLKNIYFTSPVASTKIAGFEEMEAAFGGGSSRRSQGPNERECWERGKQSLINLLETMIADREF